MTHVIQTDSHKETKMKQAFSKMSRTHWNTNSNDIASHRPLVRAADQRVWKLALRHRGSFMSNGISQQCAVRPGAVKTAETETSNYRR